MVVVCLVSFRSDITGLENSAGWAEMGFQSNRRRGKLLKQQQQKKNINWCLFYCFFHEKTWLKSITLSMGWWCLYYVLLFEAFVLQLLNY